MLGEQKHIDDDVLGEIHTFALMVLSLQSSIVEEWLSVLKCKKFAGRTLVVDENSTDYRLCIMLEAMPPFYTPTCVLLCLCI